MEVIHIVLGKANPERMNGVNRMVNQLASQQHISGRKVEVWGISNSKEISDNYVFELKLFSKPLLFFRISESMKLALSQKGKNTTVHLHGAWVLRYWPIVRYLIKSNIPYVITPHGGYNSIAVKKSRIIKNIYFKLIESKIVKKAKFVHCIGESEVLGLNKLTQKNSSFCQPFGFSFEEIAAVTMPVDKNSEMIFSYMGRFDIYTKGLDLLIAAFSKLIETWPNTQLWLIGDGNEKEDLQILAEKAGISKNVVFFGAKFGNEKLNLMQMSHVFVHPSRNEGLPTAILEASALCIPTIASKATNIAGWIDKCNAGWSIGNDSVSALYCAMELAINTPRLKQGIMGKNALDMLKSNFNWLNILAQFDKMYLTK